jgi:hypothetical protein
MVQDTTAVDRTRPQQQVTGAGPMDFNFRREAFLHPMVAFSYVVIFEPSESKSVYATLGIKFSETGCPNLNEVVRAIARLGGFMDRLKNGAWYPNSLGRIAALLRLVQRMEYFWAWCEKYFDRLT